MIVLMRFNYKNFRRLAFAYQIDAGFPSAEKNHARTDLDSASNRCLHFTMRQGYFVLR